MKRRYPQWLAAVACFVCAAALCLLAAVAGEPAAPAAAADVKLAFAAAGQEYTFNTGLLRGTLRGGGKSKGLLPVKCGDAAIAGSLGILSPYRLLTADARFGTAAWDWASQAQLLPDGAVEVRWSPDADHPLEMTAVYRWAAANTLDFTATVKPQRDLKKFELFLASYFAGFPVSQVYVQENPQAAGKPAFMEAVQAAAVWQAFPRDDAAAGIINDGRWKFPPNPVEWKIMPRLAAPLAMRRDAKTGLAAVLMAPPGDCFAVLTPFGEEGHRSLYLSLFGRDLKAGEPATARARLVVGREISDEQAVALYRAYVK
ncbi:MAG: hypothetical protein NT049_12825 [Planctomycetota bacterium]|nr:hypothetical protein [Planctomycetota bacterium]